MLMTGLFENLGGILSICIAHALAKTSLVTCQGGLE